MIGFNLSIKGVDKIIDKYLDDEAMVKKIDHELDNFVLEVNEEQVERVTKNGAVDKGFLRKGNKFNIKMKLLQKKLYNDIEYSPFIEFGTGETVVVPKGLEQVAGQFRGKGIRKLNLPARPFFFAPFREKVPELMKRLKKIVVNGKKQ